MKILIGKKSLIADEDDATRLFLGVYLKRLGAVVLEAEDVTEAVKIFYTENPDLVIADLGFPSSGGLDLIREIRKSSAVPVIAISGMGDDMDSKAIVEGANLVIQKPVFRTTLLDALKKVIGKS